ncbi:hypothetical protein D8Y22_17660 [Salinadaptatus halalkaliphilus]|uniref:Uncharacterized protein n=1 Tax=Salinadaptatus halalkaliphilus TaxID=2419781 RepID=A0A4S3TI07_9EURY|nr:hypothetical protein [Salinadaptatus halalkaliphilus]THE63639.1 hypothetical protein D8Y22_17660 [Salinadaptatus halalkaliphilus]
MTALPAWIDDRLDPELNKKLTQRHVIETMIEADRPFFSAQQIRARVRPDVSKETVRNRLAELREIDIVAAETYPESITLYYVNHPESNWPLSPEGQQALAYDTPLETLSLGDFLRLRNPAGLRTLVLAGFQLSLVLFCAGTVFAVLAVDPSIQSENGFWEAAANLFVVAVGLLLAERVVRTVRNSDSWGVRSIPMRSHSE